MKKQDSKKQPPKAPRSLRDLKNKELEHVVGGFPVPDPTWRG